MKAVAPWSGRTLDPEIVAVFQDAPGELLAISSPDDFVRPWSTPSRAEHIP